MRRIDARRRRIENARGSGFDGSTEDVERDRVVVVVDDEVVFGAYRSHTAHVRGEVKDEGDSFHCSITYACVAEITLQEVMAETGWRFVKGVLDVDDSNEREALGDESLCDMGALYVAIRAYSVNGGEATYNEASSAGH